MKILKKKNFEVMAVSYFFLSFAGMMATILDNNRQQRTRRWKVRPINRKREKEGHFATLFKDMWKLDTEQFFKYSRMTQEQFKFLLNLIGNDIQKDRKKQHISPAERLIITLHYLSEGCSMQEIAWNYRIGKATAHVIIKETCRVLWEKLQPTEIPPPTRKSFEDISSSFFKRWNLPNCIGAVDGKHVTIMAPKKSGSAYFNYKKNFSIVLMATCDAYYRFTMVDIGAEGCNHDSAVFKASSFGSALINGQLDIPPPKCLPKTNLQLPHFFVADAAFPLHENIIRPYPGNFLGETKNIFNYRMSRARRCIENSFGILSQRWRILRRPINASVEVAELIVQATIVLHNFLQNSEKDLLPKDRKYCPTGYADYVDENGQLFEGTWRDEGTNLRSVSRLGSNNYTHSAKNNRDKLADFFISREGWVPWQEEYVHRGGAPLL